MNNIWNVLIHIFGICEAILLPLYILQYVFREKYMVKFSLKRYRAAFYQHPEKKEKIINSTKQLISLFRFMLWLSPFYVIFVPWAIAKYSDLNGFGLFPIMAMLFALVYVEYHYVKWLYNYLIRLDNAG